MHQDQRVVVEQYIHGLVFTIGCNAESSGTRVLEYRHPLANNQIVLPRLLDMALSMCDANLLEPGQGNSTETPVDSEFECFQDLFLL